MKYYTVYISGEKAVQAGYAFQAGHCYAGVYNARGERVAQLEVVRDDEEAKLVDVSYIAGENAVRDVIDVLARNGFAGLEYVVDQFADSDCIQYVTTTEKGVFDADTITEHNDEQNEEENEMDNNSIIETMRADIIAHTERSAWSKGVTEYALELLDTLAEGIDGGYFYADGIAAPRVLEKNLLNGAADWSAYSWGGCSLIYDADIAERLCTPSELKKTRNGERKPNAREEWLDCQARALYQAARRVMNAARRATGAA